MLFPTFATGSAQVNGVEIAYVAGGRADGAPLLLLHGHPQTRAIWHRLAPQLAAEYRIVAADLRGYGDSAKPPGRPDHYNYSKREMARDMVLLMRSLGHESFFVCAHDRGARVAHRLCLDHAAAVRKVVLLDIAPTLAMYEGTNLAFAQAYWHWFFLIQPHPLPERMIEADVEFFVRNVMSRGTKGLDAFAPEAMAEYVRCARLPGTVHAICEDYRAAATVDLEHDRADRAAGRKLHVPLRVYWGAEGVIERCFNALALWRDYATEVDGEALPCGHYIPEEAPDALASRLLDFFR